MNRVIGAILVVVGLIVLILGINASESFASDVSKFFTGNPTDRAMWMIILGAASLVGGLVLALVGKRALPS
jgi:hypothetical protein